MVNRAKKTFERNKQTHKEYNFRFDQPQLHSNPYQNQNHTSTGNIKHSKKPIVLDEGDHKRQTGKLKFFDEEQKFGFIVSSSLPTLYLPAFWLKLANPVHSFPPCFYHLKAFTLNQSISFCVRREQLSKSGMV